jgi:hypothetical protein
LVKPGQELDSGDRQRRAAQYGKNSDPGEVFAGGQPGNLGLDEIEFVVNGVEIGARRRPGASSSGFRFRRSWRVCQLPTRVAIILEGCLLRRVFL